MTLSDFKFEFNLLYNKFSSSGAPGYVDKEISTFLTKAQERVVLKLYNTLGNKYREGFEETEQRRKQLQELVYPEPSFINPSANQDGVKRNGVFFDLPDDFLFTISESANINDPACTDVIETRVKPITHDEYEINIKNPFKKPSKLMSWRLDLNSKHEIISYENSTVILYNLRYLKKPRPIILDSSTIEDQIGPLECELNSILHRYIIDEAVALATGSTNPELYQIKNIERQLSE